MRAVSVAALDLTLRFNNSIKSSLSHFYEGILLRRNLKIPQFISQMCAINFILDLIMIDLTQLSSQSVSRHSARSIAANHNGQMDFNMSAFSGHMAFDYIELQQHSPESHEQRDSVEGHPAPSLIERNALNRAFSQSCLYVKVCSLKPAALYPYAKYTKYTKYKTSGESVADTVVGLNVVGFELQISGPHDLSASFFAPRLTKAAVVGEHYSITVLPFKRQCVVHIAVSSQQLHESRFTDTSLSERRVSPSEELMLLDVEP
ncbi:uncharacterized protein V6R79_004386 [Siganus canaliculatus]